MGLFTWLGKLIDSDARQRARVVIPKERNLTTHFNKDVQAVAETHYIQLWISELFLEKGSKFFTDRFPLAYSLVGLSYGDQHKEFANVSGKNRFEIEQPKINRSILRDYPLTPRLPFRGGEVELDCGLVSMQASNVLESFAGVVSELAGKLNAPQVSQVVEIAGSIATGVQTLLGAGQAKTVLYVHQAFQSASLKSGFIFLSGKMASEIKAENIWITDDGVRTGTKAGELKELDAQDFLVLRIDCHTSRDDWESLSTIRDPFREALKARVEGDNDKAKLLLAQAKLAAYNSNDLIRPDRTIAINAMDKAFIEAPEAPSREPTLEAAIRDFAPAEGASVDLADDQLLAEIAASA